MIEIPCTDAAYLEGWQEARSYDGCLPSVYESEEESTAYINGYGDGMDINIHYENGIAPFQQVLIANPNRD